MNEPDRPCPLHPPPSTLFSIACAECGAWRFQGSPTEYFVAPAPGSRLTNFLTDDGRALTSLTEALCHEAMALLAAGDAGAIRYAVAILRGTRLAPRKPYHTPTLRELGTIADLTKTQPAASLPIGHPAKPTGM